MKNMFTPLLLASSFLLSTEVLAAKSLESCEVKVDNVIEYSQCLDIVKESIDRELQIWVNNQVFNLEELVLKTGRKSSLDMFKRSQRNFVTFRENNCRWQYLALSPNKKAAPTYKKCYILTSQTRIKELEKLGNQSQ